MLKALSIKPLILFFFLKVKVGINIAVNLCSLVIYAKNKKN